MAGKIASIEVVTALNPIDGADNIELATVLGWNVVVRKGEFSVGEKILFLELDAQPPDEEVYWFLWGADGSGQRKENFRVRTKKLRGVFSQGVVFKLVGVFASLVACGVGESVAERLNITHYTKESRYTRPGQGDILAPMPAYLKKTDEDNVKSIPMILTELQGKPWYATVKYDGMSATYCIDPFAERGLVVCSRNFIVKDRESCPFWSVARKYDLEHKMQTLYGMGDVFIQGEVVGPGIQGNALGLKEVEFRLFSVTNIKTGVRLGLSATETVAIVLGVPMVAMWEYGAVFSKTAEELQAMADAACYGNGVPAEGLVFREESQSVRCLTLGGPISFKIMNRHYKEKE